MSGFMQRWRDFQPTKTQAFSMAATAVAITLIIGFGLAGWVTAGTAHKRVQEAAANARHELATAVCVEEFMAQKDARAQLAELNKSTWWDRSDRIARRGLATMPDREQPNSVVASLCAARLAELESPGA